MKKNILLVDDEMPVLRSLNRLFINNDFNILLANNGKEALKILESEKIDLLITDMKMPLMDGYSLLKEVKKKYPDIMRLVLSGYTEKNLFLQAIKENLVLFYILKPWDNDKLFNLVIRLFKIQDTLKSKDMLEMVIEWEKSLIIKNSVYKKLINKLNNNDDIMSIGLEIEKDPLLLARILRFVHSSFDVEIGSVSKALGYFNLSELKSIIIVDEFIDTINITDNIFITREKFLKHTKVTNKIVNLIYKEILKKTLPENCRSAGLLYNIGILIMLNAFKERYIDMLLDLKRDKRLSSVEIEEEYFSINHQEVGGYLLSWWGLPYPIVEAAFFHHTPTLDNVINNEIVCVVNIAAYYAWRAVDSDFAEYSQEAFEYLKLDKGAVDKVVDSLIY